MKIRNKLLIGAAVTFALAVLLFSIVTTSSKRVNREGEKHEQLMELEIALSQLEIISYEYLLYHEQRMVRQWQSKYDAMGETLKGITALLEDGEEELLKSMHARYRDLSGMFSQLRTNYKKIEALRREGAPQEKINAALLLEKRQAGRLLTKSQAIVANASKLGKKVHKDAVKFQTRVNIFTLILTGILSSAVIILSFLFIRTFSRSLREPASGAKMIGEGDLDYRIASGKKDEIGELSFAFNQMAEKRKGVEDESARRNRVIGAINRVLLERIRCKTEEELGKVCLSIAEELTGSKFGFFGEINEKGLFDTIAISNPGWDECKVPRGHATLIIKDMAIRGVDRGTMKEGKSRIVNGEEAIKNHADHVDIPRGHPPLYAFLGVPFIKEGKVMGMIGLGNKEGGYHIADEKAIEGLSVAMMDALASKRAEDEISRANSLLDAIRTSQYHFIAEADQMVMYNKVLDELLKATESEYGLIAETVYEDDGTPYLMILAISDVAWDQASRETYKIASTTGLGFRNMKTLFGAVVSSGKPVISNDPAGDPRSGGTPEGHPPLNTFLGIPFYKEDKQVGIFCIANREDGYDEGVVQFIQPFTETLANLVEAVRAKRARKKAEERLKLLNEKLEQKVEERTAEVRRSEEKYRAIFDQAADSIVLIDPANGKMVAFNEKTYESLGYRRKEFEKLKIPDFEVTESAEEVEMHIEKIKREGSDLFETKHRKKDGELRDILVSSRLISIDNDTFIQSIWSDITERKRAEAERKLSAEITTNMNEGVNLVRANDGIIVFANPKFEEMFGYEAGKMIGRHISIVNAPSASDNKEAEGGTAKIIKALNESGEWRGEIKNIRKDGTPFWCYASVSEFNHPEYGKVWVSVHEDITERKRAEELLRDSEEKFRATFEQAAVGVGRVALDGRWLAVNRKLCEIAGYSREELLEKTFQDITYADDLEKNLNCINKILEGEIENYAMEKRYIRKDGSIVWINLSIALVRESAGKPKYFISVIEDISYRKESEELLLQLNSNLKSSTGKLEAANKDLESFSYSVSHDLRAPLRAIDGFSRILLEEYGNKVDEEGQRYLKVVRDNANKMGRLIDDILKFSRMGRKEMNMSDIDMKALALKVFNELKLMAPGREINFKAGELPTASGDQSMIRQVFANLLSNAIKFTKTRDVASIEVDAKIENDEIIYSVRDNGVGFDMAYKEKLFAVFQRLHGTDEFEGTGAGLAIVKRIIDKHGGRLWAEGTVGKGAIFRFTLPEKGVASDLAR
ncbi:MAG: PAS domain S-box protein [Deltaproteobacteria bacterium]|nr:PAS domain S-box protein [Deltaproteobacteria bacterium]